MSMRRNTKTCMRNANKYVSSDFNMMANRKWDDIFLLIFEVESNFAITTLCIYNLLWPSHPSTMAEYAISHTSFPTPVLTLFVALLEAFLLCLLPIRIQKLASVKSRVGGCWSRVYSAGLLVKLEVCNKSHFFTSVDERIKRIWHNIEFYCR